MVRRFLLDQNFPAPIANVAAVDATVQYVPVRSFDASLTAKGTPDWLIYLRAAEDGSFSGVVTRDAAHLREVQGLWAVIASGLAAVTWQRAVEDPIQEWGQLLAYMPHVLRRLDDAKPPNVFYLPRPRLGADNAKRARALLGELASKLGTSFPVLRDEARREMDEELQRRGLAHLSKLLTPGRRRAPAP